METDVEELKGLARAFQETHFIINDSGKIRPRDDEAVPSTPATRGDVVGSDAKMWAITGGQHYFPCESTIPTLPPGQYTINHSENRGIFFTKQTICLDELLILPDSAMKEIIDGITHFWNQEDKFREFKFLWKRGVLLWGSAGSGKSSLVQMLSQKIVELGGFSVYVSNPDIDARGLKVLRLIEPDRPIVVMLEDIDAIIRNFNEATVLALFDGELQINNVVFIATTNYPGRLDPRIINRPSRFDVVKKIGMLSAESRRVYLKHKHPTLPKAALDLWIKETEDFSFAHLKEVIVATECLGQKFEDVVARLRSMMELDKLPEFGEDYKKKNEVGFGTR